MRDWLLLVPVLPAKPDYARVKTWRRMQQLGAVNIRGGLHILPSDASLDLRQLRTDIEALGGSLTIWRASLHDGLTDAELVARFREQADREYAEIAAAGDAVRDTNAAPAMAARLRRRLNETIARDHFQAPGRAVAEARVATLEEHKPEVARGSRRQVAITSRPRGVTWVTRSGVFVDRIASAWLIRRFIDPRAKFRFVRTTRHKPKPDELRFDMFEGEFSHRGDRCTFEVLLDDFALGEDDALAALGEIVHDIDLKDDKFSRAETAGIAAVLRGLATAHASDEARIKAGVQLFDTLHAQFSAPTR